MNDNRNVALMIILFCAVASFFRGCNNRVQLNRIEAKIDQIEQNIGYLPPLTNVEQGPE